MLQELDFTKLTWRQFEQMLATLLEVEGFVNVISSGGSGGDMGLDISAEELRRSLSGRVSTFRWMIQAKHYAGQAKKGVRTRPRNVGHKEIVDIISFLSEHKAQGFLLITDTDLTPSAVKKITSFHEDNRHPFEAHFWNQRILSDRLRKHPEIVYRYFGVSERRYEKGALPANPFKFLEPFRTTDRQVFFGRDREIQELAGLVCNAGVVVLFGESGTGKTSLLSAGLLPQLSNNYFITACARCLEDPASAIRREALRSIQKIAKPEEISDLGGTADMAEFLRRLKTFLDRLRGRMVIAVDQFEEAFTRAGKRDRESIAEAVRVVSQPDISRGSLTIIFSIREDYLGSLWEWSHRHDLADVWGNAYRIARLSLEAAGAAVNEPLLTVGRKIEKRLSIRLLRDLEKIGDGRIYPPYAQIVCGSLVEEAGSNKELTLELYKEMGGAESLIGNYLDSRMFTGLSTEYADLARSVLDSLTGGEGLRTLLSMQEIEAAVGSSNAEQIKEVVDFLIKRRVVLPHLTDDKVQGYELVHDFLSRRFFERLNPAQKRERAMRDIFRRAFRDWKNHGILLSKAALDDFFPHHDNLSLGPGQSCMVVESAFAAGKYRQWKEHLNKVGTLDQAVLYVLENTKHERAIVPALRHIRKYLRKLDDISLVTRYLKSEDFYIEWGALVTIERLGDARAIPALSKYVNDKRWDGRLDWEHYRRKRARKVLEELKKKTK